MEEGKNKPKPPRPEEILEDIKKYAEKNPFSTRMLVDSELIKEIRQEALRKRKQQGEEENFLPEENKPEAQEKSPPCQAIPLKTSYCKTHRLKVNWRCTECGRVFCESCVKPRETFYTLSLYSYRAAVCPECKGRCEDFRFEAEKAERLEKERYEKRRDTVLSSIGFTLCLILFLLVPDNATFFVLVISAFWFGPLKNVELIYKLNAVFVIGIFLSPIYIFIFGIPKPIWAYPSIDIIYLIYLRYIIVSAGVSFLFIILDKGIDFFIERLHGEGAPSGGSKWIAIIAIVIGVVLYVKISGHSDFGVIGSKSSEQAKRELKGSFFELKGASKTKGELKGSFPELEGASKTTVGAVIEILEKGEQDSSSELEDSSKTTVGDVIEKGELEDSFPVLEGASKTIEMGARAYDIILSMHKEKSIDEVWKLYESNYLKNYSQSEIEPLRKTFYKALGNFKTVGDVIEKGDMITKNYLYSILRFEY